jgi:hypothetical protein
MSLQFRSVWIESWRPWPQVFKRIWSWTLFVLFTDLVCDGLTGYLRAMDERYIIVAVCLTLAIQIVLSAFSVLMINQIIDDVKNKTHTPLSQPISAYLKYIIIETTRAVLPIILKTLLFIIPGIIESVRLYFIPYVVQYDPAYKAGQVDALVRSRQLVKGKLLKVMGILILTMVLSIVPRLYLHSVTRLETALLFCLALFVCLVVEIYGYIVLYFTYEKLVLSIKESNGHSISLQGTSQP